MPQLSKDQNNFNFTIGQLDYVISLLMLYSRDNFLEEANKQTLKHHAEDMIAAGNSILKKLGNIEGTPQPE